MLQRQRTRVSFLERCRSILDDMPMGNVGVCSWRKCKMAGHRTPSASSQSSQEVPSSSVHVVSRVPSGVSGAMAKGLSAMTAGLWGNVKQALFSIILSPAHGRVHLKIIFTTMIAQGSLPLDSDKRSSRRAILSSYPAASPARTMLVRNKTDCESTLRGRGHVEQVAGSFFCVCAGPFEADPRETKQSKTESGYCARQTRL